MSNVREHLFQCLILRIKNLKPKVASNMRRNIQWTNGRALNSDNWGVHSTAMETENRSQH